MHKITTFDDQTLYVSDEQAEAVIAAMRAGNKYVTIDGVITGLAISGIASILEETRVRNMTDLGRLHDGSRVRRVFGEWRDMYNADVRIDPAYYPEVAEDCVPSLDDYERLIAPLEGKEARLDEMRRLNAQDGRETERLNRLAHGKGGLARLDSTELTNRLMLDKGLQTI